MKVLLMVLMISSAIASLGGMMFVLSILRHNWDSKHRALISFQWIYAMHLFMSFVVASAATFKIELLPDRLHNATLAGITARWLAAVGAVAYYFYYKTKTKTT